MGSAGGGRRANLIGSHEQQGVADEQCQLKELGFARKLNAELLLPVEGNSGLVATLEMLRGGLEIFNLTEALKAPGQGT